MMETMEQETMVTVRSVLVKETSIWGGEGHQCMEYEIDPDTGHRVPTAYWESDEDEEELFRQQERSPIEIIMCCEKLCKQLMKEGHYFYAGILLSSLKSDCQGWDETEFGVK